MGVKPTAHKSQNGEKRHIYINVHCTYVHMVRCQCCNSACMYKLRMSRMHIDWACSVTHISQKPSSIYTHTYTCIHSSPPVLLTRCTLPSAIYNRHVVRDITNKWLMDGWGLVHETMYSPTRTCPSPADQWSSTSPALGSPSSCSLALDCSCRPNVL